jgi:hypothetical protein
MYHPIVKELVLPGLQEGQQTNPDTTETLSTCQALVKLGVQLKVGLNFKPRDSEDRSNRHSSCRWRVPLGVRAS